MKKYFAFGEVIETDINFDDVLPESSAETTLRIFQKTFPEKTREPTKVYRAGVQATFTAGSDFDILYWAGLIKYKISDATIIYQSLGAAEAALRIFTLSEALGVVLLRRKYFLLHGCSILIKNKVHVFIGEPGAGKSTTATAFWQAGCTVLSDDLTVIKFIGDLPVVLSGIPTIKVWSDALTGLQISTKNLPKSIEGSSKYLVQQSVAEFPKTHFPLHSITCLLAPETKHTLSTISALHAPTELLKHFPVPDQLLTSDRIKRHFEQSIGLAATIPLRYLARPHGFAALEAFVKTRL